MSVQAAQQEKEEKDGNPFTANVSQLLGIRGGSQTADKWKIRLQLTKPVTWIPLIWGRLYPVNINAIHLHKAPFCLLQYKGQLCKEACASAKSLAAS